MLFAFEDAENIADDLLLLKNVLKRLATPATGLL